MARRNKRTSGARNSLILLLALTAVLIGAIGLTTAKFGGSWSPKLALDLSGGTEMILAPQVTGDNQEISADQLNQAVEIIRQRVDGAGVSEAEVTTQSGHNVVVSMPGVPDQQTRELIQASAQMSFRSVLAESTGAAVPEKNRTDTSKLKKSTTKPQNGSDSAWITPELQKQFEAKDCTKQTQADKKKALPADQAVVACSEDGSQKYILGPVEIQGSGIKTATATQVQSQGGVSTGQWGVNLSFNDDAKQTFKQVTERLYSYYGKNSSDPKASFAIMLDGNVLSAPRAQQVIADGNAQITGSFTEDSAKNLAEQLKYGALPISFTIQSEQQISATLGTDQLRMGIIAGLIGLALVCVYSLFQYRLLGLVTIASLVVAGVLSFAAIVLLGWGIDYRLSLAGVAGLIVAIGQTADSFIVYFERIRDGLREGRGVPSAVDHGWERARRTILASKAVNLLASVVLYFVAVGNVRGFAFTLGLTAIADLVVVFLFTHPLMVLLSRTRFFGEGHRLSGLDAATLGRVPVYRGAGRLRDPEDAPARGRSRRRKDEEPEEHLTIAQRRRREELAARGDHGPDGDDAEQAREGAKTDAASSETEGGSHRG